MTKGRLLLAAHLLDLAADEFGNHGCNDLDLSKFMGPDEALEFERLYHETNGDPQEFDPKNPLGVSDFCAMGLLSKLLRHEAIS